MRKSRFTEQMPAIIREADHESGDGGRGAVSWAEPG
jgi:hypothetical protein